MPRYVVERTFPHGLQIEIAGGGVERCRDVVARNADEGVTWLQSFVTPDKTRSYCVYEAPSPEAIRKTADRNALPVDRITEVRVLDPHFYV